MISFYESRWCKDSTQFHLGIQFDWGIVKHERVLTIYIGYWSWEIVFTSEKE